MPIIQQITAQTSAQGQPPQRNATPDDFGAGDGAGYSELGHATQQAVGFLQERAVQTDVANVRVKMAEARAQWDVAFREQSTVAKPGEDFSGKFNTQFKDYMSKARDIAQTQQGQRTFDVLNAELSSHFTEKAGLFQVKLAGDKAKQDWTTSLRAYGTSLQTDPSSYGSVLAQAMTDLKDPNGAYAKIDTTTRGALELQARNQLAQNYVQGFINMKGEGPALAERILNSGKLDDQLDPKTKETLIKQAELGVRRNQADIEHAEARARREEKDRVAATNDDLMGKWVSGKLTMNDVRNAGLPPFGEGSQHSWISMLKAQAKDWSEKPAKTSPTVYGDLLERSRLPYGDPRKLTDVNEVYGRYGNGLSAVDTERIVKKIRDDQSDDGQKLGALEQSFLKGVKPQLDKSDMNKLDVAGAERMYQFQFYVDSKVAEARKANKDPRDLFNPGSSEYLGKAVPTFQTGAQRTAAGISTRIEAGMDKGKPRPTLDSIFGAPKAKP